MLGHLGALIPGKRLAECVEELRHRLRDRLAHGFGTMTSQGWPVLDGLAWPMAVHARQVQ
ncbi:hypothetical protein NRB_12060 [Novosphingobium sp. 11B]